MKISLFSYLVISLVICATNSYASEDSKVKIEPQSAEQIKQHGEGIEKQAKEISLEMSTFKEKFTKLGSSSKLKSEGFCQIQDILLKMKELGKYQCSLDTTKLIKRTVDAIKAMHQWMPSNKTEISDVQNELKDIEKALADKTLNDFHDKLYDLEDKTLNLHLKFFAKENNKHANKYDIEVSDILPELQEIIEILENLFQEEKDMNVLSKVSKNFEDLKKNATELKNKISDQSIIGKLFKHIHDNVFDLYFQTQEICKSFGDQKYKTLELKLKEVDGKIEDFQNKARKTRNEEYHEESSEILNLLQDQSIQDFRLNVRSLTQDATVDLITRACDIYSDAARLMSESAEETESAIQQARRTAFTTGITSSSAYAILSIMPQ